MQPRTRKEIIKRIAAVTARSKFFQGEPNPFGPEVMANIFSERTVTAVFDLIRSGLIEHGEVKLPGFGTFKIEQAKARKHYDIRSEQWTTLPAREVVKFVPSGQLTDELAKRRSRNAPLT